jgi:hypothetical protein
MREAGCLEKPIPDLISALDEVVLFQALFPQCGTRILLRGLLLPSEPVWSRGATAVEQGIIEAALCMYEQALQLKSLFERQQGP